MLKGKGFYIWQISACEGGYPDVIAQVAKNAGLSHVLIKIADADVPYNLSYGRDLVPPVVVALRALGISVWGWVYTYGGIRIDSAGNVRTGYGSPEAEARMAAKRFKELQLDGLIVNAEKEYKTYNQNYRADRYMKELRLNLTNTYIGLSTYRYPSLHREFAWAAFRSRIDFDMPQVYWLMSHNPAQQLNWSMAEYGNFPRKLPFVPTGAAFKEWGWQPTVGEVTAFLDAAKGALLPAVNFWSWDNSRKYLPDVWDAISSYQYPVNGVSPEEPEPDLPSSVVVNVDSLNVRNAPEVAADTLIGSTWRGARWDVTGAIQDQYGRTWYEVTGYLAGWLVEKK